MRVGVEGFEPPKATLTDLQSAPFDHSGKPPICRRQSLRHGRAGGENRTPNLLITNQPLCRLSYASLDDRRHTRLSAILLTFSSPSRPKDKKSLPFVQAERRHSTIQSVLPKLARKSPRRYALFLHEPPFIPPVCRYHERFKKVSEGLRRR